MSTSTAFSMQAAEMAETGLHSAPTAPAELASPAEQTARMEIILRTPVRLREQPVLEQAQAVRAETGRAVAAQVTILPDKVQVPPMASADQRTTTRRFRLSPADQA